MGLAEGIFYLISIGLECISSLQVLAPLCILYTSDRDWILSVANKLNDGGRLASNQLYIYSIISGFIIIVI